MVRVILESGDCVKFHSLASLIPFEAVSDEDMTMSSKMSEFLAFHRVQQIQGRIIFAIPEGGRHTTSLKATTVSLKSQSAAMLIAFTRSILLQTSLAYWKWKNIWFANSFSLHLTQYASELIPRDCRFSPKGIAL